MKFIMGALGVIFLVILVVVLITRGGKGPDQRPLVLSEQAREGVSAVFTEQGQLVGQDQRRAIRITVNQNERRLEILTGYEEAVLSAQTYANTQSAFEAFLVALDQAGFDNKRVSAIEDERGACPLGHSFIYQLNEFSQPLINTWSTTCGKTGTFNGNRNAVRTLFRKQIPGYSKLTSKIDMSGSKTPEGTEPLPNN
jgi:hypothetical protein